MEKKNKTCYIYDVEMDRQHYFVLSENSYDYNEDNGSEAFENVLMGDEKFQSYKSTEMLNYMIEEAEKLGYTVNKKIIDLIAY